MKFEPPHCPSTKQGYGSLVCPAVHVVRTEYFVPARFCYRPGERKERRIHRYRCSSRRARAQQSCRRQPGRAQTSPRPAFRAPCPGAAVGPLPEIARPDRERTARRRRTRGLPWRRRSLSAYIPNLPNYRPLPPHTLTHAHARPSRRGAPQLRAARAPRNAAQPASAQRAPCSASTALSGPRGAPCGSAAPCR